VAASLGGIPPKGRILAGEVLEREIDSAFEALMGEADKYLAIDDVLGKGLAEGMEERLVDRSNELQIDVCTAARRLVYALDLQAEGGA
jgi:hypothetical protein